MLKIDFWQKKRKKTQNFLKKTRKYRCFLATPKGKARLTGEYTTEVKASEMLLLTIKKTRDSIRHH